MKIVFAGPSLPDAALYAGAVAVRGPAALGDVARAVIDGATAIGIIDGYFENTASVWHKEILYALSRGVRLAGAASMGALRAAECAAYGMVGIGVVYARYASGALVDDDAVGQVHGPEELGYVPLSDPLVNIEATLDAVSRSGGITDAERAALAGTARATFFKDRTFARVLDATGSPSHGRRAEVARLIDVHRRDLKHEDALALLEYVASIPDARVPPPTSWRFAETQMWMRLVEGWRATPESAGSSRSSVPA
jgi:hypothetical protein